MITIEQFTELAHRTASRYSHRSEPARAFYTFSPEALAEFHRQARAAIEADRAQRVPDGWANLLKAAREVLSWTQAADRPPVRDEIECGRMTGVRVHALADLHEAVQALASTPAPAQQEPATPMDAHRAAYFMRRFLHEEKMLGPNEQAALHFTIAALEAMESAAQHQEPPQQERGPMTEEQIADDYFARSEGAINPDSRLPQNGSLACFTAGVRFAERHHGIRKD